MDSPRSAISGAAERLGLALEARMVDALVSFGDILATRGVELGVVSAADRDRILERHVVDCMRALPLIDEPDRRCLDLGAGAGLPGIVVAIGSPRMLVELVEARRRRVAFLELVAESLGVGNVRVTHARIEHVTAEVELCLARALAPPDRTWSLARGLLRPGGRLVYFAGSSTPVRVQGPDAPLVRMVPSPLLESSGPLVIMTRQ